MTCIEIFSGAGGLAKGLELAGLRHKAFVEWNADACRTLRLNFEPSIVYEGDVRSFPFADYTDVDVIAGGPPCQPFSLGGKARGNGDERDMFPSAIAAIRTLRPKAFIFENVKGLLRASFAEYFRYIILQLKHPGVTLTATDWRQNLATLEATDKVRRGTGEYRVTYTLVNAADYGVPQQRERVIIVGLRSDLDVRWSFPPPTHSRDALLWSQFVTGEYWQHHGIANRFAADEVKRRRLALQERYGAFPPEEKPWRTVRDAIAGLGEPCGDGEHQLRPGAREYPGHTGSDIDEPSKTVKAGGHGVPGGENMMRFPDGRLRYYSVAEAKRIQTFPDDYRIAGAWSEGMRQLGNAVPVALGRVVALSVREALDRDNNK